MLPFSNMAKMENYMSSEQPVGVFDSGVGGLSVLLELQREMPYENYLYLGDTGRNPYGPKSIREVRRYTLEAATFLAETGAKAMVIACNTAAIAALDATKKAFPHMLVIGVVEPGCIAAAQATNNEHIALVATEGTVVSNVHATRINELRPGTRVTSIAAPIFVSLAEEGWQNGKVPDATAERYLEDLFNSQEKIRPDCLLLGCTHFPLLRESIQKTIGDTVVIVDPAQSTAQQTRIELDKRNLLRNGSTSGTINFYVTAAQERFSKVGSSFMKMEISPTKVHLGCRKIKHKNNKPSKMTAHLNMW